MVAGEFIADRKMWYCGGEHFRDVYPLPVTNAMRFVFMGLAFFLRGGIFPLDFVEVAGWRRGIWMGHVMLCLCAVRGKVLLLR